MHPITMQDRDKVNRDEEVSPPLPVEELYTAIKKKPKGSYSSVPANEPVSQAAEDLYTVVMKKPKESFGAVSSIPPHTVEELCSCPQKSQRAIK